MQRFELNRVDLTERIESAYASEDWTEWSRLGDELRWLANIPLLYQALNDPRSGREFQRAPQRGEEFPGSGPSYWTSLVHLLTVSFGWEYPALGIEWWLDNGRPTDDPRFALIEQTFVADGQFDPFAEWLFTMPGQSFGFKPEVEPDVFLRRPRDREWLQRMRDVVPSDLVTPHGLHIAHLDMLYSHTEPHHEKDPTKVELLLAGDGSPRGTLMSGNLAAWSHFLHEGYELREPHPSGRSWRIDVVVKPIGWLGTFRRSRETGRWFTGPHHLHRVGSPD